jgi:hypothetical protein
VEMTKFIFEDLKDGIAPWLIYATISAGTIETNKLEIKYFINK